MLGIKGRRYFRLRSWCDCDCLRDLAEGNCSPCREGVKVRDGCRRWVSQQRKAKILGIKKEEDVVQVLMARSVCDAFTWLLLLQRVCDAN